MDITYKLPQEFNKPEYTFELPGYIDELEAFYKTEFQGKLEKLEINIVMEINRPLEPNKAIPETFNEDGSEGKIKIVFTRHSTPKGGLSATDTDVEFYKSLNYVLKKRIVKEYKDKFLTNDDETE